MQEAQRQVKLDHIAKSIQLPVPTDIEQVKQRLRQMGEPVTLFGEGPAERFERLKYLIAQSKLNEDDAMSESDEEESEQEHQLNRELFFTPGSTDLKHCRELICKSSLFHAKKRIEESKKLELKNESDTQSKILFFQQCKQYSVMASEMADERPISCVSIFNSTNTNESIDFCIGSWSCNLKHFQYNKSTQELKPIQTYYSHHEERITCVKMVPHGIWSGSADGTIKFLQSKSSTILCSPQQKVRVSDLNIHPHHPNYLISSHFDHTWKLWDISKQSLLLQQYGHTSPITSIAFQCDGSLLASSDMGALIKLWDLRIGKNILNLTGHCRPITSIDFHPCSNELASGGDDNSIFIWDIRHTRQHVYTIPAHCKLISKVKYEPKYGRYLMSVSYDQTVAIWKALEYKLIKRIQSHESKIMDMDIESESGVVVTVGYDKTIKCLHC